jgi:hypothetical protein
MQKFLRVIFCLLLVSTMAISLGCTQKEEAPPASTEEVAPPAEAPPASTHEVAPPAEAPPAEEHH